MITIDATKAAQAIEDAKPKVVTKLQMMEAMLQTDVTATSTMWSDFKAIRDAVGNELIAEYWLNALDINRNHAMTLGMMPLMGKTVAQLDDLFQLASTL